ncbi:galactoside alpha-(1,2)-fucosyltransferase 2 isoform X1 [Penaeus vannamei]|uniref:galactoside alpha-(1,2)-fucosyltransferase 2 isoform X1 n=1 Tax=Penaeus vannamei TaxID=6689 RepID=UPI00387FA5C1
MQKMDGLRKKISRWFRHAQKTSHKTVTFPLAAICIISLYGILDAFTWHPVAVAEAEWRPGRDGQSTVLQKGKGHSESSDKPLVPVRGPFVPQSRRVRFPDHRWRGYPLPALTAQPFGRLGNVMGEYASLWALARIYNVTAFLHPSMKAKLHFFDALSLPEIPGAFVRSEWQDVRKTGSFFAYNYTNIERAAAGLLGPKRFCLKPYPFEIHLFNPFKEELRREFVFPKRVQEKVREILADVQQKWQSANNSTVLPVLVGFHVRRADYVRYAAINFRASLPEDKYFTRALSHYRQKFPNEVAFVVASDDMAFVRQRLGHYPDVFFSSGESAADDMALLSSCNHSIVTMGSYGFWTGFLAGGEVVYPDLHLSRSYRFSRAMYQRANLTNFIPVSAD